MNKKDKSICHLLSRETKLSIMRQVLSLFSRESVFNNVPEHLPEAIIKAFSILAMKAVMEL